LEPKKTFEYSNFLYLFLALLVVGAAFFAFRKEKSSEPSVGASEEESAPKLEALSEPAEPTAKEFQPTQSTQPSEITEAQKTFGLIIDDMGQCLDVKAASASANSTVDVQTIVSMYQSELGPAAPNNKWQSWMIRTSDGKQKLYRIDEKVDFDGSVFRELEGIEVDQDGAPIPLEIDGDKAINPSAETVDKFLSEGTVEKSEKAGFFSFRNGERFDFVERDGKLVEVELVRGDRFFRCTNVMDRSSCQCLK
jgi:hypothetical protein